jgi:hypothetical protein
MGIDEDLMQSLVSKPVAFPVEVSATGARTTDLEIAPIRLSAIGLFSVLVGTLFQWQMPSLLTSHCGSGMASDGAVHSSSACSRSR